MATILSEIASRWRHPATVRPPVRQPPTGGILGVTYPGVQSPTGPVSTNAGAAPPAIPPRGFARGGGRISWDDVVQYMGGFQYILPPDDYTEAWRMINLDADTIAHLSATRLLQILADVAPDVSRGLWDFLRLCNPGWTCTAYLPGGNTPSPAGQKVLNDWTKSLADRFGSVDVPIGRLHFGGFLRGALMAELVFDETGKVPIDLATPDPATARFRRRLDPVRGQVWDLGQFQMATWVLLDRPTIRYVPIDPAPGSPYGRSPSAPALFTSLFLLGLLHDLRRVVAQQGYPRYDLVVQLEALTKMAPAQIRADPTAWKEFVDATTQAVSMAYNELEPDSAFVHTDLVLVNKPTGAVSADVLNGVSQLIEALERQLARALKSMPLLMGMLEGSSEANANRQWELQAAGVKSVQHLSEAILSDFGTLVLEAAGVPAECKWVFAELRAAEMYRDAMTKALTVDTATKTYFMGWESQESASMEATGHAPDQAMPRLVPSNELPPIFGNATASGSPGKPGGANNQKRPNKGSDNTGGDNAEVGATSENPNRSRRDFLRLRWPFEHQEAPETRTETQDTRAAQESTPMTPLGRALPYVPQDVNYDAGDQRRVARVFDSALPQYAGLLDARVSSAETERRWESGDFPQLQRTEDSPTEERSAADVAEQLEQLRSDVHELLEHSRQPEEPPPPSATRKRVFYNEKGHIREVIEEPYEFAPPVKREADHVNGFSVSNGVHHE